MLFYLLSILVMRNRILLQANPAQAKHLKGYKILTQTRPLGRYEKLIVPVNSFETGYCDSFPVFEVSKRNVGARRKDSKFSLGDSHDPHDYTTSNQIFFHRSREAFISGLTVGNMKSHKTVIDEGSTRGTGFVPGYQGYIPADSRNLLVAKYESQTRPRR